MPQDESVQRDSTKPEETPVTTQHGWMTWGYLAVGAISVIVGIWNHLDHGFTYMPTWLYYLFGIGWLFVGSSFFRQERRAARLRKKQADSDDD